MEKKLINGKVYKETDFEEVVSSHNEDGSVFYHIFYGDVDWHKNGNRQKAICVFMRYGDRVNVRTPANILLKDLLKVEEAIAILKSRNMEVE
ncbi:hypothetical protein BCD91_004406 [Clostridium beijerinckii]|uniref:hypothetical protein n=1 Tax=Clostridium TaxID=1485 RepID=UPI001493E7E8|nr:MULTISPECIES: hypothetical protein [Clostridium]NOW92383.1 hypothetical protein [Clostridium beijerinckii]